MDVLKSDRSKIKTKLTKFRNDLDAGTYDSDIPALRVRLSRCEPLLNCFDTIQDQIDALTTEATAKTANDEYRDTIELSYCEAIGKARELIRQSELAELAASSRAQTPQSASNVENLSATMNRQGLNLPKISVPKFNGDYGSWIRFRDTFESMVHKNSHYTNVEKFHYLEDALIGDASTCIAAYGLSDLSYKDAWAAVRQRYDDDSGMIHHHVSGIFEAPAVTRNSASELRTLLDTVNNHLICLKALKQPTEHWDTLIIYLLTSKLNSSVRNDWVKHQASKSSKVTYEQMRAFLDEHVKYLQKIAPKPTSSESKDDRTSKRGNHSNHSLKSYSVTEKDRVYSERVCNLCSGSHALYKCEDFKKLSIPERVKKVIEFNICFNCLASTEHGNKKCRYRSCYKCHRKHNKLLHTDETSDTPARAGTSEERTNGNVAQNQTKTLCTQATRETASYVLLPTASVYVYDPQGNQHLCRAFLDSCSQPHIISSEFCKKLGMRTSKCSSNITGIEQAGMDANRQVTIRFQSRTTDYSRTITCVVLNKISDNFPSNQIETASIQIPSGIELADPEFDQARPIDLLIGASLFYELESVGRIKLDSSQPTFKKTLLGWIVAGDVRMKRDTHRLDLVCNLVRDNELSLQMEKFWRVEHSFSEFTQNRLVKNDFSEKHFIANTRQNPDGRYEVAIPFIESKLPLLGDSREMAHERFISTERKLEKNPAFKEQYVKFMNEYIALGHMSELSECNDKIPHFYLPHHAVFKEDSTTTKLRVVFDASAKTSTGLSLNDVQHVGPPVNDKLFPILLRFRFHRFVISADINKMFRQVLVRIEDRAMQRILWREEAHLPIKVFELNTVTPGTASGTFLATRCLYDIGERAVERYPQAADTLLNDTHVDDTLTGADNIQDAIKLKSDLQTILGNAGMQLHKWASNDPRILLGDTSKQDSDAININGEKDPKTLGLFWNSKNDTLKYKVNRTETRKCTKRIILSIISQIFDPLGLVGPAIIQAKIIMQKLWTLNLSWDESLPEDVYTKWIDIYETLMAINQLVIPRHVVTADHTSLEFHGFCDASENAYGACIYICSIDANGSRTAQLLCAKSRVAPLQNTSIPRLELLGAVLLAQLAHTVSNAYKVGMDNWYFWSDSMVTLAWIRSPSYRWKTFVANRVALIQELSNENWNHIESAQNPADLISRGITAAELCSSSLWWNGPKRLSESKNFWPVPNIQLQNIAEQRKDFKTFMTLVNEEIDGKPNENLSTDNLELFEKFSSFMTLVRTIAYVLKFYHNCKNLVRKRKQNASMPRVAIVQNVNAIRSIALTAVEVNNAKNCLLKLAQATAFQTEISSLKSKGELSSNSKLKQLDPFLDTSGLLRVGGRLENANIPYSQKHPIILASSHKLTFLLIRYEHLRLFHGGCQSVLMSLRRFYWPLTGKNVVKKVLRECVTCFKNRPVQSVYPMGNLPQDRVSPMRAFYNCGVDYAGPFLIKEKSRSRVPIKGYACIIVCFATKAIHIELAPDLSAASFLNCFKRFISRRGKCRNIYSDNGKNFVGARNEIVEFQKLLSSEGFRESVSAFFSNQSIDWHFIPPRAPHFGGLWESAVKSTKFHLSRVMGEVRMTFEELYTVLTQIEAILNSRPLSPLSNDPNDLTPLTPAHFLIGDSLMALPEEDVSEVNIHRLNRFQLLQQVVQQFWKRWHREYLPQLQRRQKLKGVINTHAIAPGVMVLIKQDNMPPMQWPLGRIIECHPGRDKVVRVVSVRVARGVVKRDVSKICVLPFEANDGQGVVTEEEQ